MATGSEYTSDQAVTEIMSLAAELKAIASAITAVALGEGTIAQAAYENRLRLILQVANRVLPWEGVERAALGQALCQIRGLAQLT